jgi:3-methyladenine DNA glycosylase AlkD
MENKHTIEETLSRLHALANPANVAGMGRYGINTQNTLGISIYTLRPIAKEIGLDHELALQLWESGIHEARILASYIDDPAQVTSEQMDRWADDFDSWDVCDQVCELFGKTRYAYDKVFQWSARPEEFVKRAAYALLAELTVRDKKAADEKFEQYLPVIEREAGDERNFVKKAVNWALRNIGKRNPRLNALAVETAQRIQKLDSRSARWIAADALRELTGEKVQKRLNRSS